MEAKFKIGDKIWYATTKASEKRVPCADCFGKRRLIVILGDDSKLDIPCEGCSWSDQDGWGYHEPYPHGYCRIYEWQCKVEEVIINRVEINVDKVEYGFNGNYRMDEDRAFLTEEEAVKKSQELIEEQNREELAKLYKKEKPTKTWAWNLSYHRKRIKDAERDIAYHTAKLNAGKVIKKEETS